EGHREMWVAPAETSAGRPDRQGMLAAYRWPGSPAGRQSDRPGRRVVTGQHLPVTNAARGTPRERSPRGEYPTGVVHMSNHTAEGDGNLPASRAPSDEGRREDGVPAGPFRARASNPFLSGDD